MPPSTTPHIPLTSVRASAFIRWQVEVPMITSIWPASWRRRPARWRGRRCCRRRRRCPRGCRPEAASAVRPPTRSPSCATAGRAVDEAGEARVQARQELRRGVGAVLVEPLVAGRAGVAHEHPAELPDDPVRGLHPPLGRAYSRGLLEHLERLRELPLRGGQPAVPPARPRPAPRRAVDPVRLGLGRVVLPELDVGVRLVLPPGHLGERRPVGERGQHVLAVKSVAIPTTSAGRRRRSASAAGTAVLSTSR